jgi:hypothetical protein
MWCGSWRRGWSKGRRSRDLSGPESLGSCPAPARMAVPDTAAIWNCDVAVVKSGP